MWAQQSAHLQCCPFALFLAYCSCACLSHSYQMRDPKSLLWHEILCDKCPPPNSICKANMCVFFVQLLFFFSQTTSNCTRIQCQAHKLLSISLFFACKSLLSIREYFCCYRIHVIYIKWWWKRIKEAKIATKNDFVRVVTKSQTHFSIIFIWASFFSLSLSRSLLLFFHHKHAYRRMPISIFTFHSVQSFLFVYFVICIRIWYFESKSKSSVFSRSSLNREMYRRRWKLNLFYYFFFLFLFHCER